jgi:hypothetical protein
MSDKEVQSLLRLGGGDPQDIADVIGRGAKANQALGASELDDSVHQDIQPQARLPWDRLDLGDLDISLTRVFTREAHEDQPARRRSTAY